MLCNIIAQRIELQEYLANSFAEISAQIDEMHENKTNELQAQQKLKDEAINKGKNLQEETKAETHTKDFVIKNFFNTWLNNFKLKQPDRYFIEHNIEDIELECNIQSELEFTISTLEICGLPKGYMDGVGHHLDWDKQKDNLKGKKNSKKAPAKKKGPAPATNNKTSQAQQNLERLRQQREAQKIIKPMWFDLLPFKAALEKFLKVNAEKRSEMRGMLIKEEAKLKDCFLDENSELSYKKIVDLNEFKKKFSDVQLTIDNDIKEHFAAILVCFGNIDVDKCWGDREPEETAEEKNINVNIDDREKKLRDLLQQREKDLKSKK